MIGLMKGGHGQKKVLPISVHIKGIPLVSYSVPPKPLLNPRICRVKVSEHYIIDYCNTSPRNINVSVLPA